MLTSQIPRLNRKKMANYLPKQIRKLVEQYEAYVALTRTSIGMRRQN